MQRSARKLSLLLVLLVLVGLIAPTSATAVRTIGLSTGTFDFSVAAGKGGTGEVVVMNNGDENLSVLIYAANQKVDASGAISYEVPNRDDQGVQYNPALWLQIKIGKQTQTVGNTPYIELTPGEQVPVSFEMLVPQGTPPGDHQVLIFFEMRSDATGAEGEATPQVSGRVGARISVRVEGEIVEKIDVRPFATRGFILGKTLPYTFVLLNEGNIDKPFSAKLTLLDSNLGEVLSSNVTTDSVVYAGTNIEFSDVLRTQKQLIGKYTMRLEIEYPREGSDVNIPETLKLDKTVWIVPLWLAIAVVVVVGLALILASYKQSVHSAERRIEKKRQEREARRTLVHNEADYFRVDRDDNLGS
ncbi:MAG: hypothetical protein CVT66_04745 [Actinobacteria bacterium HGW-Actinobacteria-6]|jgi:hypothetical protein|nr:MAG: hypothetical protein CVT66_04745 [Actinobacteria bacterium HGW-Actinobacteria-6]